MIATAVLIASLIALAAPGGALAAGPPQLARSIPLPGVEGRIDHLAYDPGTRRLFVAALGNGSLEVVDLEKGERVKSVGGLQEPQGVAYVAATKQVVVACGGDGSAHAYDAATLEEKVKVVVGDDADNVRLTPDGKTLIVGYGSGALALLDSTTLAKVGDIPLAGHPESFQIGPASPGRPPSVFVNVPGLLGGGKVVVVDLALKQVTATWSLKDAGGADHNFPMALDTAHQRLYVGCRGAARLVVLDTGTGKVVTAPECVGDTDDIFVDSATGAILVIGGGGAIDVFATADQAVYTKAASVATKPPGGARTGLLIAERRALYLAVPRKQGHDAEIREYVLEEGR